MTQPALDAFRARIQAYMLKAVREAKAITSWVNPNAAYEAALARFVDGLLGTLEGNRFIADFVPLQQRLARIGCVNSLAQTLVKHTSPGVPDTYQGTELWDLSLVDPDNRRPVDYRLRTAMLDGVARDGVDGRALLETWADGRVKLWLTWKLLELRRRRADWIERAGYLPIPVTGSECARVCAYARSGDGALLLCVVPRLWSDLVRDDAAWPVGTPLWGDTALVLPRNGDAWRNALTGEIVRTTAEGDSHRLALGEALATFPVGVFEPA
jgi:(1->4)-alpha-D-glucan 1-alpha-D-glucosylmutase